MLLRTRLILIVTGVVVGLTIAQLAFQATRNVVIDEANAERIAAGHLALWNEVVEAAVTELADETEDLGRDTTLTLALESTSAGALNTRARVHFADARESISTASLTLYDDRGEVRAVLGNEEGAQDGSLLADWQIGQVIESGRPLGGIRADSLGKVYAVHAVPIPSEAPQAIGVIARPLDDLMLRLAEAADAHVVMIDQAGELIRRTSAIDWNEISLGLDVLVTAEQLTSADGISYGATVLPVRDLSGGSVGSLVLLTDVTQLLERLTIIDAIFYVVLVLALVLILWLLFAYLRQSFVPLEDALGVLDGLTRRDTSAWIEQVDDRDEIGRLGRSITILRDSVKELNALDKQRGRRRSRQQRFIRTQMTQLARTLDQEAADALLRELDEIETEAQAGDASGDDLSTLAQAFRHMATRVGAQHNKLTELVAELREALAHKTKLINLQQELDIAARIQLSVIPRSFPDVPQFEVYGTMIPAREVGGDFFDVFEIDEHRIGVAVADVSGKGIPAAFFMLIARTLLKATALFGMTPGRCLEKLNDLLAVENDQMMFVTMFYGILDCRTGEFTYANGGHNPPVLVHKDGGAYEIPTTQGMGLAVMDGMDYLENVLTLQKDDAVVMFTDGVTEAFDKADTLYGEARLVRVIDGLIPPTARGLVDGLVEDVVTFAEGVPQADDITCVALVYRAEPQPRTRSETPEHTSPADDASTEDAVPSIEDPVIDTDHTEAPATKEGSQVGASLVQRAPDHAVSHRLPVPGGAVGAATEAAEEFIQNRDLPPAVGFQLSMVLDELVSNIVKYGYPPGEAESADIILTLWREEADVWIELSDDGSPFDPFSRAAPDTDLAPEDRPIGGLGIHLVRHTVDVFAYRHEGGRNIVTLRKSVS